MITKEARGDKKKDANTVFGDMGDVHLLFTCCRKVYPDFVTHGMNEMHYGKMIGVLCAKCRKKPCLCKENN